MRFHLPTRDTPQVRGETLPPAPVHTGPWFTWAAIAIVVLVAAVVLAVATIPGGDTEATLEGMSLEAQHDLFSEVDAATRPADLEWLDLDRQRTVFRSLESSGVLTGVGLDAQRTLFRVLEASAGN